MKEIIFSFLEIFHEIECHSYKRRDNQLILYVFFFCKILDSYSFKHGSGPQGRQGLQYGFGDDCGNVAGSIEGVKSQGQQGPGIIGQHRGGGTQGGLRARISQGISSILGGKIMLCDGGGEILGHLLYKHYDTLKHYDTRTTNFFLSAIYYQGLTIKHFSSIT